MISIPDLLKKPDFFREELQKRNKATTAIDAILATYETYRKKQGQLELLRKEKNDFNALIVKLQGEEKIEKIKEMKDQSEQVKMLESETRMLKEELDKFVKLVPNPVSSHTPIGKSEDDNQILQTFGEKPKLDFIPKPYWELEVYKKYVNQEDGTKAMGSRGFYLTGEMARFQKVLLDYALDFILKQGHELFYVPLMLNEKVLTGTGHLPDFDGQQYEIKIDENKNFYLIGSSEPSIMGYFMDKNLGQLDTPILATCHSSCFRKEAGSYGKDQQGILRVHQFEKIEMVAICKPEDNDTIFEKHGKINESLLTNLGLHFQKVEICTGDMPTKHYRQHDYEVWFCGVEKFREVSSNGSASDFQNRGLNISYVDGEGKKSVPWGLNCTGMVFRSGLAILEQNQDETGSKVKIPEVLVDRFGKEWLE